MNGGWRRVAGSDALASSICAVEEWPIVAVLEVLVDSAALFLSGLEGEEIVLSWTEGPSRNEAVGTRSPSSPAWALRAELFDTDSSLRLSIVLNALKVDELGLWSDQNPANSDPPLSRCKGTQSFPLAGAHFAIVVSRLQLVDLVPEGGAWDAVDHRGTASA